MFFFQQNFGLQNRVDYVDLLYIHQPVGDWLAGYRQLEKAYRVGKAKAIGISNFEGKYLANIKRGGKYMTKKEIKELREMGYETEEEFIEEILGCDENYSLDDFMDSYDPD